VLAAGKAAASMALAVERNWPADKKLFGIALTRYGHALPLEHIRWVEAGHPVPDEAGETAAREMLGAARAIKPMDLLLALVSGGGSALLALPVEGVSIADLRSVTRDLPRSGATIQEINAVRKHLSQIQGGRLAAACRAPVLTLIISDVTGDDPTHIASGPCAPDPTRFQDAVDVLNRFDVKPPRAVLKHLIAGLRGEREETPKPGSPVFENVENRIIATARRSLEAAAKLFRDNGVAPVILGDSVTGEAREVAKVMAAITRDPHVWLALQAAGRAALGRRVHGHGKAQQRPRRALRRIPARARHRAGRRRGRARDRRGHGRHRRLGRQCGRPARPGLHAPRARTGPRSEEVPRDQRQLRDLLRARRPGGHRPDTHQRQRLPRDSGQLGFFGCTFMWLMTLATPSVFFAIAMALFISALLLALPLSVTTFLSSVSTWICLKLTCLSLAYSALILVVMTDSLTFSLTFSVTDFFSCAKDSAGMLSTAITRIANSLLFIISPPG
jgi:hypothetical protein